MAELLGRRDLERRDRAALRVERLHDLVDRAVLAGGVDALEDDEDRLLAPRPRAGPGGRQALELAQRRLDRRRLVVAERRAGVHPFEPDARARLDPEGVSEVAGGRAIGRPPVVRARRQPGRTMATYPKGAASDDRRRRDQATSDLPRRSLGRVARRPGDRQPGRPIDARRRDLHRHRGAVRGGGRGRRRGVRGHPEAAGLRARPDPARDQRRDQGAARGARPADRARGRQADPRRAGRGRPRDADLPPRRRGGGADDRRAHPARPDAGVQGPDRDHPALPDRPDRRASARSTSRSTWPPTRSPRRSPRQPDRAQAAVQGPAHDARRGRDHRGRRRAGGLASRSCR